MGKIKERKRIKFMKKNYFKIYILFFLFLINYSKIYGEEENKKEKEWAITTIYNRGKFYGYGKGYFKDDGPSTTYGVMYMPAKEVGFGFIFKTMESVFKPDPSKSFFVLGKYIFTGEYINKIYSLGTRVQTTDNSVFFFIFRYAYRQIYNKNKKFRNTKWILGSCINRAIHQQGKKVSI
jgi:hypothetical protein